MKTARFTRFFLLVLAALGLTGLCLHFSDGGTQADGIVTGTPTFQIKNPIDQHVLGKLQSEKIEPSMLCTDEEFLRRASLDLNGNIPTLAEVKAFLADRAPNKREKLIEKLLKSERYGDHFSAMWGDLLREHTNGRPQEGTVRGSYREWIQKSLNDNIPYDTFAKTLIDAVGNAEEDPASNFYLRDTDNNRYDPTGSTNNISTVFMGTRMACAQCHDHPFDKWTQNDFHGLQAFFGRTNVMIDSNATLVRTENNRRVPDAAKPILEPYVKEAKEKLAAEKANFKKGVDIAEEGNGGGMMGGGMMDMLGALGRGGKLMKELEGKLTPADMQTMRQMLLNNAVRKVAEGGFGEYRMPKDGDAKNRRGGGGEVVAAVFPWDQSKKAEGRGSRRAKLAEFIVGNRQFAAVQANRIWANLMGRGIVEPIDDFRPKNPPANPELLDFLTDEFIKLKFDNKALIALIMNSSTYQRSSMPNASNRSDTTLFSHARLRHMTAEQLFDSILVATGRTGGLGEGGGFQLGMGREMMEGKFRDMYDGNAKRPQAQWAADLPTPARTGSFMNVFNQPTRDETICKRDESGSIPQALEMFNGGTVNGAIMSSNTIKQILSSKLAPAQAAQELFMSVLSRAPNAKELSTLTARAPQDGKEQSYRVWLEDAYWALLNTREFAFVK